MRKAFTSKKKKIIMKPEGMEETLQVLRYLSLFMCFLVDFFFVSILKRHERYLSKQPIYWHLCIQKLRISPGGGLTGEKRGKITNKVEKENVNKKTLPGRCWRVWLSFSLSSHIIQGNLTSKGFHCDGFKLVWRKRLLNFLANQFPFTASHLAGVFLLSS